MAMVSTQAVEPASPIAGVSRVSSKGYEAGVLADVYRPDVNIAVWQRDLPGGLASSAGALLAKKPACELSARIAPGDTAAFIDDVMQASSCTELGRDIADLVDMFCCLFDLEYAGLRLTALSRAMCPRFHVDNVPCRLVTTYGGPATEWLPHSAVDRAKLGRGSGHSSDSESGLYSLEEDIQQLTLGDVALLKGELWEGNEGAGLVHRSPAVQTGATRLLLTLDVIR